MTNVIPIKKPEPPESPLDRVMREAEETMGRTRDYIDMCDQWLKALPGAVYAVRKSRREAKRWLREMEKRMRAVGR